MFIQLLVVYFIAPFIPIYVFFNLTILNTCLIMLFRKFAHQLFLRGQTKTNLQRIVRRKKLYRKIISSKTVRSRPKLKRSKSASPCSQFTLNKSKEVCSTKFTTNLLPAVSRIHQSTANQTSVAQLRNSTEMDHLDNLIDSSVQNYLKIKEDNLIKNSDSHLTKESKPSDLKVSTESQSIDLNAKNEKKRKIEDESSDEECCKLPRRRVMTMGEFNKRKRVMTKYQRELMKEREEEKFLAQVYDEDYDDSLADFVVAEDSMFIDNQMMSSDNDVLTTSAFLRDNPSFVDDECEENQEDVKDFASDSEEEQMYLNAKGIQNFYGGNEKRNDSFTDKCREDRVERKDCFSDSEEEEMYLNARGMSRDDLYSSDIDFLGDDETLSGSSEFTRNIERKRPCHDLVIDDVSVEEGEDLETDDLGDEIEEDDDGSDLDSFINDSTMIEEEESDDENEVTNLNSSGFYKKKKRTRVIRLESSDEENITVIESSKAVQNHKSPSILSTIENTSFNKCSKINTLNPIICDNQLSTVDSTKNCNHVLRIQCSETIILNDSSQVVRTSKTLLIDDSDNEIKTRPKTTKSKSCPFDSDDETGDLFLKEDHFNEEPDARTPSIMNDSKISISTENDNFNEHIFSTGDDSTADCLIEPKTTHLTVQKSSELHTDENWFATKKNDCKKDKTIESDDESVISAKNVKPKKMFESDDEDNIVRSTRKSNRKKVFESDEDDEYGIARSVNRNVIDQLEDLSESIECIFSECDPINRSNTSDFELNEEDLEDGTEDTLT